MKLKIGKRSKYTFVMTVVFLLMCLAFVPSVIAATTDEIYDVSYEMGWSQIPYGDGIDNDHDGTIDETDGSEPDVVYGTKDVNTGNNTIFDSWYNAYTKDGVVVGGSYEELWRISCSANVSISPTQTCYQYDTYYEKYQTVSNVINAVTFYVNIPASKLMNGASEFWYRSPLLWDDAVFSKTTAWPANTTIVPNHYVNIYDDDNNLVYASENPQWAAGQIPAIKNVVDDSGYERLYYKINMNFRTDITYRFEEYVKTIGNNPISSIDIFMARFQDIAGDGQINTYNFWNTSNARKVATECSWSAIFTLGKGLQGGEKILFGGYNYVLTTQKFAGDPAVLNTGSITVIFPLRTTRPLNITVWYKVFSGSNETGWLTDTASHDIVNACGTLICSFNISTDPDHVQPNDYQIRFYINNLDDDYNGINSSHQAMTFYMFPNVGNVITISNGTTPGVSSIEANHFACHIEIANEKAAVATKTQGANFWTMLVGFAIIIIGIILIATVIGAVFGVELTFAGITIATGAAIAIGAVGVGTIALGSALVWAGASGYSMQQFWNGIADGTVRLINTIIKGIQIIGGAIWDGMLWVVTKLIQLGAAIMYWGAAILNMFWEVFAFIAFLIVLYCWNWFLVLMKHISRGDIESAFSHAMKPVKKYGKKTVKYIKKERKGQRAEARQERKTVAYEAAQGRRYIE